MTITANDLRKIADAMDAAAATQQEIAFLKSEVARLRTERNYWKDKANTAIAERNQWRAKAISLDHPPATQKTIPHEIKKKLISCVHPDHCNSIHATSVSQWLLAQ